MKQLFVYIIINTITGASLDSSGRQILYHSLGACNIAASNLTWALQNHTTNTFKCVQIPDPQRESYVSSTSSYTRNRYLHERKEKK